MIVYISLNADKNNKVYHKQGCFYEKRMKPKYRLGIDKVKARRQHFRECKYCAGLQGEVNIRRQTLNKKENDIKLSYDKKTDTVYIETAIGFWKVYRDSENGKYNLFHRNKYYKNMDIEVAKRGEYHRQRDVKSTESFEKILNYVIAHDKAKQIIREDYRKLPRTTKRQKKYYEIAKKRERKKEIIRVYKRIDDLFSIVESQNGIVKSYSLY